MTKSPAALIERFAAALPEHPALSRKPMFGYAAAFVNRNMVCGLFRKDGAAARGRARWLRKALDFALTLRDVRGALNLSEAQRDQIRHGGDAVQAQNQVRAVLTPEQKAKLDRMRQEREEKRASR